MIAVLISLLSLIHPFHVSVCEIKYREEQKALQISTRIFLDDLELGLKAYAGREKFDIMEEAEWDFIDQTLEKYLLERISLADEKGRPYELKYIGAEIEEDVMWCYLEVEKVKKLRSVEVRNTVLHEVWGDQENLVHFRAFDEVKSARLYKGEETRRFDWQ